MCQYINSHELLDTTALFVYQGKTLSSKKFNEIFRKLATRTRLKSIHHIHYDLVQLLRLLHVVFRPGSYKNWVGGNRVVIKSISLIPAKNSAVLS